MDKAQQKDLRGLSQWCKHYWLLLVLTGFVLASVLITLFLVLYKQPSATVEQARTTAQQASDAGNYDQALADLQKIEKQATTKAQKIRVYNDLASAAANAGQVGQALHYYELKHELDPGSKGQDAYLLATLYERSGDEPEALAQYQLALEYLKTQPTSPDTDAEIEGLQAILQDLAATP
jgi:tetratricopeptide (TPR) repeat protein